MGDKGGAGGSGAGFWLVVASGLLWAVEVIAWRKAAEQGMGMWAMTGWTGVWMGVGGSAMLLWAKIEADPSTEVADRFGDGGYAGQVLLCLYAGVGWLAACFCFNAGMGGMLRNSKISVYQNH